MPEDEEVCNICGKVLETLVSHQSSNHQNLSVETPNGDWWMRRGIILDILANNFMPTYLTDQIILFHDQLRKEKGKLTRNLMESLAYSTYAILNKEQISRSPAEIGWYFGINPLKLHHIEKSRPTRETADAKFILPRIMSDLDIPFPFTEKIHGEIEKLQEVSISRPETIVGCAIFRACRESPYRNLKLTDIANACGASHASIRSLNARMTRRRAGN